MGVFFPLWWIFSCNDRIRFFDLFRFASSTSHYDSAQGIKTYRVASFWVRVGNTKTTFFEHEGEVFPTDVNIGRGNDFDKKQVTFPSKVHDAFSGLVELSGKFWRLVNQAAWQGMRSVKSGRFDQSWECVVEELEKDPANDNWNTWHGKRRPLEKKSQYAPPPFVNLNI